MCKSGATFLPAECCSIELVIIYVQSIVLKVRRLTITPLMWFCSLVSEIKHTCITCNFVYKVIFNVFIINERL
jgi:hypothetical protein